MIYRDLALDKYHVKVGFLSELSSSEVLSDAETINEYTYYVSHLLSKVSDEKDFFIMFPHYSHKVIEDSLGITSKSHSSLNMIIQNEAEEKYPNGASLLREIMLMKLID